VIGWADRQIESLDLPPAWLIDLAMSHQFDVLDVIALLKPVADGAVPAETLTAAFALLPKVEFNDIDAAEKFAKRLYSIAYDCLHGDWTQEVLVDLDQLSDGFDIYWGRSGSVTEQELMREVSAFVARHRQDAPAELLHPVTWHIG
jgi:hypothetical protein